jgi:GNAT superfamily N-acetyltransferase
MTIARRDPPMTGIRTVLPGQDTVLACWSALARISAGARLVHTAGAVAAVFPSWAPLNNAILLDVSDRGATAVATAELRTVYASAGVAAWAVWLSSAATDFDAADTLGVDGYSRDTTTLVMQAALRHRHRSQHRVVRTSIATVARVGDDAMAVEALGDPDAVPRLTGWALVHEGLAVASAWSYLHRDDVGIYAVGTAPPWRRRGFASALMQHVLADAAEHGARTASLQSTAMGRTLYETLGFAAVGRYEEWVPQPSSGF